MVSARILLLACLGLATPLVYGEDYISRLQTDADTQLHADFGHWGWEADKYQLWGTHSNRLIPVYTYGTRGAGEGIDLISYTGERSPYRSAEELQRLYGQVPHGTLNSQAYYLDQTNIADLQRAALAAGKKQIFLVVFDGMDWQTTWAASIYKQQRIAYEAGRGTGLHFQDYTAGGTTQFGVMVTSPYADDYDVDVNTQQVTPNDSTLRGGYSAGMAGSYPWSQPKDLQYLIGRSENTAFRHAYTDSASSATSMTAGIKTYNASINVTHDGRQASTVAHVAQQQGYRIGVVTSVPISHATPAAAYSHNVHRNDYQDLTRDLLGLKSISHPEHPLPGVDVLIACGYGVTRKIDNGQGENFVPGNAYLTEADLQQSDVRNGGRYRVAQRTTGANGQLVLEEAAAEAASRNERLLGYFGVSSSGGHLPYRTADGDYHPAPGRKSAEEYSAADIAENPNLADFTRSALTVLGRDGKPFWLMVESGDVDWANHDNNIDNSIGAVLSGDAAIKVITDWVETHSNWDDAVLIVTADHGHYLVLEQPELLVEKKSPQVTEAE